MLSIPSALAEEPDPRPKTERVPSTIGFVYTDMSDAIFVAESVLKGGGVPLSRDQLAAAMGQSPVGGGFATKVATAKSFGVLVSQSGKYQLTEIGFEIVDSNRSAEAKVKAFLEVELFRKAFEEFKGRLLPPRPQGLEAAFVNFGVSVKNVKAARLAFDRSARLAGMFPNANEDRLVMPIGAASSTPEKDIGPEQEQKSQPSALVASVHPAAYANSGAPHPLIAGMIAELPAAKSEWSKVEQAVWLDTLAGLFRVVYKNSDNGAIDVRVTE